MIFMVHGLITDGVDAIPYNGQAWHSDMALEDVEGQRVDLPETLRRALRRDRNEEDGGQVK